MSDSGINISNAESEDLYEILALEERCFSFPWTAEQINLRIYKPGCVFLKAAEPGRIVGYVSMEYVENEGYIGNIAVDPGVRCRGIGEKLLTQLRDRALTLGLSFITLEVRAGNAAAIGLYEKCGYIKAGSRRGYYFNPVEDALLMTIFL